MAKEESLKKYTKSTKKKDAKLNVDAGKPDNQLKKENKKYRLYLFQKSERDLKCMECQQNLQLHGTQDLKRSARNHLEKCQKRRRDQKSYSRKNVQIENEMSSSYPATAASDGLANQDNAPLDTVQRSGGQNQEITTTSVSKNAEEVEAEAKEDEYDEAAVNQDGVPLQSTLHSNQTIYEITEVSRESETTRANDEMDAHKQSITQEKADNTQDRTTAIVQSDSPSFDLDQQLLRDINWFGLVITDIQEVRTMGRPITPSCLFYLLRPRVENHNENYPDARFAVFNPLFLDEFLNTPAGSRREHMRQNAYFIDYEEGRPNQALLPIFRHGHFALAVFGKTVIDSIIMHLLDSIDGEIDWMINHEEALMFAQYYFKNNDIRRVRMEKGGRHQVQEQENGSNDCGIWVVKNAENFMANVEIPLKSLLDMQLRRPENVIIADVRNELANELAVTHRAKNPGLYPETIDSTSEPSTSTNTEDRSQEVSSSHEKKICSDVKQISLKRSMTETIYSEKTEINSKTRRLQPDNVPRQSTPLIREGVRGTKRKYEDSSEGVKEISVITLNDDNDKTFPEKKQENSALKPVDPQNQKSLPKKKERIRTLASGGQVLWMEQLESDDEIHTTREPALVILLPRRRFDGIKEVEFELRHFKTLKPRKELVDVVIDFMLRYHAIRTFDEHEWRSIWFPSCTFFAGLTTADVHGHHLFTNEILQDRNKSRLMLNCKNVQLYTENVDLFSKKLLMIPVNVEKHWILALLINPIGAFEGTNLQKINDKPCFLLVLNSYRVKVAEREEHIKHVLSKWLRKTGEVKDIGGQFDADRLVLVQTLNVPQQQNGSNDCGPYVCFFAKRVMQNLESFMQVRREFNWIDVDPTRTPRISRQDIIDSLLENADGSTRERIAKIGLQVVSTRRKTHSTFV